MFYQQAFRNLEYNIKIASYTDGPAAQKCLNPIDTFTAGPTQKKPRSILRSRFLFV